MTSLHGGRKELLALVGNQVCVLHGPQVADDSESTGGDLDCAVDRLDPSWTLRLPSPWRLIQSVRYDITGWCWTLERDGDIVMLDTLDDVRGVGREGFCTELLFRHQRRGDLTATRAAYLVTKRLKKTSINTAEWTSIGRLAATDEVAFTNALTATFGGPIAKQLAAQLLCGEPPQPSLQRRAMIAQQIRRVRTPSRIASLTTGQASRILHRILQPAGVLVVVTGPDGSGKSTVARNLTTSCKLSFRRELHLHWRPSLLPAPGVLTWRPGGRRRIADHTSPHSRVPHGWFLSQVLLGYYWLDNLLGAWLWLWPARIRNSLIVVERGWFDIAVDPRRYRLQVSPRTVQRLGKLLPKPDLALHLHGNPPMLARRKNELTEQEIKRQLDQWRCVLPATVRQTSIDVSPPAPAVLAASRAAVLRFLEERAAGWIGAGWANFPPTEPRWWLPRQPSSVAAAALRLYQPVTRRASALWKVASLLTRVGCLQLVKRGLAPPREVRERLADHLRPGDQFAVMRSNAANRYVALILDKRGRQWAFAKLALDDLGRETLLREAGAIARLGRLLPPPMSAPEVLCHEPGLLLTRAVKWILRPAPWRITADVGSALGTFFRATGSTPHDNMHGLAHGDFAPWNLLRTPMGWVLLDWEYSRDDSPPFYDLFHFLVQSHALLKRVSWMEIARGLEGQGWIGDILHAYADAAGVSIDQAPRHLGTYLEKSVSTLDSSKADGQTGLAVRRDLQFRLDSWLSNR